MDGIRIGILLKKWRKPFLWSILFALLFFLVLFPTGDLGDLVSSKVSEMTDNKVFLRFNNFNLHFLPPGLDFEEVFVETPFTPGVSADDITITPSISALLSKKPYGQIEMQGLFQGRFDLQIKKGTSTETGVDRHRAILEVEKISLSQLREALKSSFAVQGQLSFNADGQADLEFTEQPDVDLNLSIDNFSLAPTTVNTAMGPLTLPDFKLGTLQMKGRLSNGKLNIENGLIGKKKDDLFGTIKGFWNMQLLMIGGRPVPQLGGYDLVIDLVANPVFQSKANLFLPLIDQFKSSTPEGARYHFRVSGSDLMNLPNFSAPR